MVEARRTGRPAHLIDLSALGDELGSLGEDRERLYVGALATHNDVLASAALRRDAWPLVQACGELATPLLRTRGTVVGNIVTALPEKDALVALVALDAAVELRSASGRRTLPVGEFCLAAGATALQAAELVERITIAKHGPGRRGIFLKLGLRPGHAHAIVNVAVVLEFVSGAVRSARIALGGVAPTVVRAYAAEAALDGAALDPQTRERAVQLALDGLRPRDDVRASARYRLAALETLVRRALERLAEGTERDDAASDPVRLETPSAAPAPLAFTGTLHATMNGRAYEIPDAAGATLLEVVRAAGLTGAKEGCAEGECGSCAVWLDGRAVTSCIVPAPQAHGGRITTIEALARGNDLHPLQRAFIDHAAVQCGFCIPGMIMTAAKLLEARPACAPQDVRAGIAGNICRCTGYRKIVDAIAATAATGESEIRAPGAAP